jgi:hypothetical protein
MERSTKNLAFGKHAGKDYQEIKRTDVAYCNWILKQINVKGSMRDFQLYLKEGSRVVTCEACNGSGVGHSL